MFSDSPKPKSWEELTAAASTETDPEKLGTILEEILAALEERERNLTNPPGSSSTPPKSSSSNSSNSSNC